MNNMNHDLPSPSRIVWLDIVRLTAMLMVIGVHCIDPFYISPTLGTLPEYKFWASVYGSLFRPSVPLFAMMTGLLLLPVGQQPLGVFYKKRIFRVLFPFLIWSVLYNLFPWFTGVVGLPKSIIGDFFCYVQGSESQSFSDSLKDIAMIPFNFSFKENHMWYIYLLIGLYLYMPFFSAWIDKADRKMKSNLLVDLGDQLISPVYGANIFRIISMAPPPGTNSGHYIILQASTVISCSGIMSNKEIPGPSGKTLLLSALLFAAGYSVTFTGFSAAAHNPAATESDMELFFTFCSPNVLCMTLAVFLALQKVVVSTPALIRSLANITKCGFGIYMVHYFLVGPAFLLIGNFNLPIPLQVPVMAILIFLCAWGFTALMYRLLGRKARWIMG